MTDAWLGFLGGILATLVAALIASIVQRHHEAERRKSEARLDVYFALLDLNSQYFWVASAEMHREPPKTEVLIACREMAWRIADKLRKCDAVDYLEEILEILFNNSISSANSRAKRLEALLDEYGKLINPRYARTIRRISDENIRLLASGNKIDNPAPTTWDLGK